MSGHKTVVFTEFLYLYLLEISWTNSNKSEKFIEKWTHGIKFSKLEGHFLVFGHYYIVSGNLTKASTIKRLYPCWLEQLAAASISLRNLEMNKKFNCKYI